jgi:hypothetical protein
MRHGIVALLFVLTTASVSLADDCWRKYLNRTAEIDKHLQESLESTSKRREAIDYKWNGHGERPSAREIREAREHAAKAKALAEESLRECRKEANAKRAAEQAEKRVKDDAARAAADARDKAERAAEEAHDKAKRAAEEAHDKAKRDAEKANRDAAYRKLENDQEISEWTTEGLKLTGKVTGKKAWAKGAVVPEYAETAISGVVPLAQIPGLHAPREVILPKLEHHFDPSNYTPESASGGGHSYGGGSYVPSRSGPFAGQPGYDEGYGNGYSAGKEDAEEELARAEQRRLEEKQRQMERALRRQQDARSMASLRKLVTSQEPQGAADALREFDKLINHLGEFDHLLDKFETQGGAAKPRDHSSKGTAPRSHDAEVSEFDDLLKDVYVK